MFENSFFRGAWKFKRQLKELRYCTTTFECFFFKLLCGSFCKQKCNLWAGSHECQFHPRRIKHFYEIWIRFEETTRQHKPCTLTLTNNRRIYVPGTQVVKFDKYIFDLEKYIYNFLKECLVQFIILSKKIKYKNNNIKISKFPNFLFIVISSIYKDDKNTCNMYLDSHLVQLNFIWLIFCGN